MRRFAMDRHLGRLAKWMRTLGYDSFFDADCPDEVLVYQSSLPQTVFVTTRHEIGDRIAPHNHVVVPKERIAEQLRTLINMVGDEWSRFIFSRCVICNVAVVAISKEQHADEIPARVYQAFDEFTMCPSCSRIYWKGSHAERLRANLIRLLEDDGYQCES